MMSLPHALANLVPGLAGPQSSPVQHALGMRPPRTRATQNARLVRIILAVAAAIGGWLAYRLGVLHPSGQTWLATFFLPLVLLNGITCALSLFWAADTVDAEHRRNTWEILNTTSRGPEVLLRARWAAIFVQVRPLLLVLIVPRAALIGVALLAVTRFQGHHLDLYLTSGEATVPLSMAVFLLAAWFAAALMEVPVLLGLNTAVGLLIGSACHNRALARAACVAVLAAEFLFPIGVSQLKLEEGAAGTVEAIITGSNAAPFSSELLASSLAHPLDVTTTVQRWADGHLAWWRDGLPLAVLLVEVSITQALLMLAIHLVRRPVVQKRF